MDISRAPGFAAVPLVLGLLATPAAAVDSFTSGVAISDSDTGLADLFVEDTTVLDGQLCVGFSCAMNESVFNDSIVMLKTTVPNIYFEDSSTLPNYPDRDWRLLVNEADLYGNEQFSIEDVTAGTIPFTVDGDAPDNALWVGLNGYVGFGTSVPQSSLHVSFHDAPGLRLEQNTGSGQPHQIWDLVGNENTFRILDATANSAPLTVFNDTDSRTMALKDRLVGIGTYAPKAGLHIARESTGDHALLVEDDLDDSGLFTTVSPRAFVHIRSALGNAKVLIEELGGPVTPRTLLKLQNTGRPEIVLSNSDTLREWSFGAGTNFVLKQGVIDTPSSAKTKLLQIDPSGNATLTGTLTTGGTTCGGGCDAVFDPDYALPAIADYAAQMRAQGFLPHVGPTLEGAPLNVTQKLGGMLNALEHAHLYIAQLEAENRNQGARIDALERQMSAMTTAPD